MSKGLVLRQIVARDGNNHPSEIDIPPDRVLVLQKFRQAGPIGGTIELQHIEDKVHVRGTWGIVKINLDGVAGNKHYVFGRVNREYNMLVGGKVYLGNDGIYQIQEKV